MISLTNSVGTHILDARGEYVIEKAGHDGDNARRVLLRLDGVIFAFTEDPSDGYRSHLGAAEAIQPSEIPPGALAEFPSVVITIHHFGGETHNVIVGIDERTSLALFEIGETEMDDYYPSFLSHWTPEGASSGYLQGSVAS